MPISAANDQTEARATARPTRSSSTPSLFHDNVRIRSPLIHDDEIAIGPPHALLLSGEAGL
jgi:hypothetical protein